MSLRLIRRIPRTPLIGLATIGFGVIAAAGAVALGQRWVDRARPEVALPAPETVDPGAKPAAALPPAQSADPIEAGAVDDNDAIGHLIQKADAIAPSLPGNTWCSRMVMRQRRCSIPSASGAKRPGGGGFPISRGRP